TSLATLRSCALGNAGYGSTVIVILALAMLVSTACGQVDVVLTSTGRSALSLANGLLAFAVNIGVDLALIPHYRINGAAIGWAAAIVVSNLVPLVQLAWMERVHPFGSAMLIACALCILSFSVLPMSVRVVLGTGLAASMAALGSAGGALV